MAGRDATEEFYANHKADILRRSGDKYVIGVVQGEEPGVRGRPAGAVDKGPYAEKSFRRGWRTPYYNDSHAACQTAVRTFLDNELRDDVEKFEEAGKAPSREFYRKMGAAGILAARIGPGPHLAMMERAGVRLPGGVPAAQFDFFHEVRSLRLSPHRANSWTHQTHLRHNFLTCLYFPDARAPGDGAAGLPGLR